MAKKDKHLEEFIDLRIEGLTFDEISARLDISKPTLLKWNAEVEVKRVIDIGKLSKLQTILKKFDLHREASIKRCSLIIQKINKELEKRDFSEVSSDKLLKMLMHSEQHLQKQFGNIKIEFKDNWGMGAEIDFDPAD